LSSRAYRLSLPHIETATASPPGAVVFLLPTRSLTRILRLAPSLRPLVGRRAAPPPSPYVRELRAAASPHIHGAGARAAAMEEVGALLQKLTWTRVLAHSAPTARWGATTAIAQAAHELNLNDSRPPTAIA
jgi:hypothetical protein